MGSLCASKECTADPSQLVIKCDGALFMHDSKCPAIAAFTVTYKKEEIYYWVGEVNAANAIEVELCSIICAMRWADQNKIKYFHLHSDNKIIVYKLRRKSRPARYTSYFREIYKLAKDKKVNFQWVRKINNKRSHKLCRKKYKEIYVNKNNFTFRTFVRSTSITFSKFFKALISGHLSVEICPYLSSDCSGQLSSNNSG